MTLKTHALAGTAICAALLLQGCSVMRSLGLIERKPQAELAVQAPADQPLANYTATGRTELAKGNFGLAIDAFQQALASGETAGPALNGLGVGYAGVGRTDLAAEYFRRAMASEPDNGKYAANLALLLKTQPLDDALPRQALAAVPASAPVESAAPVVADAAPAGAPDSASEVTARNVPRGRLTRVAPREYAIHVLPPQIVSGQAAAQRQVAAVDPRFRPVVRIVLPEPARTVEAGKTGASKIGASKTGETAR